MPGSTPLGLVVPWLPGLQPLWGWHRYAPRKVNPFGVGGQLAAGTSAPLGLASLRVTGGQPLRGWQPAGGRGLQLLRGWPRYALREVKPRKQLLCNSFRGLKGQTISDPVTVPKVL